MIFENAYLIGVQSYCYRAGEIAKIQGVSIVLDENKNRKLHLKVKYGDGFIDDIPLSDCDKGDYAYVTLDDLKNKDVPKVMR